MSEVSHQPATNPQQTRRNPVPKTDAAARRRRPGCPQKRRPALTLGYRRGGDDRRGPRVALLEMRRKSTDSSSGPFKRPLGCVCILGIVQALLGVGGGVGRLLVVWGGAHPTPTQICGSLV